MQCIVMAAIG